MLIFQAYDKHLEQLTGVAHRVCRALEAAGIAYRVVGGLAVFFHVQARDPLLARLTKDVDLAIDRVDLARIAVAVGPLGLQYRQVAGVDMLVDSQQPKARSGLHLIFIRERARPDYLEPVPDFSYPAVTQDGILLAPVADLVLMKLTSFRQRDKAHLIDMDSVGLITPEVEQTLSEALRLRLKQVREEESQSLREE